MLRADVVGLELLEGAEEGEVIAAVVLHVDVVDLELHGVVEEDLLLAVGEAGLVVVGSAEEVVAEASCFKRRMFWDSTADLSCTNISSFSSGFLHVLYFFVVDCLGLLYSYLDYN